MEKGMKFNLEKTLKELKPYRERKTAVDPKQACLLVIDLQNYFKRIAQPVFGNIFRTE